MIDPPGSIRLKAAYLQDFADACHDCYRGWIYVGCGKENGKIKVYKFPCHCSVPGGKQLWQCLDDKLLKNMVPDNLYSFEELPPYILIRSLDLPYKLSTQARKLIEEVPF